MIDWGLWGGESQNKNSFLRDVEDDGAGGVRVRLPYYVFIEMSWRVAGHRMCPFLLQPLPLIGIKPVIIEL